MDAKANGWLVDGWMGRRVGGLGGLVKRLINGWIDRYIGLMNGWVYGWKDGWPPG